MNCGVDHRYGSDPVLLWLWCGPAAAAPIWPPSWEPLYAVGVAQKKKKDPIQEYMLSYLCHENVQQKGCSQLLSLVDSEGWEGTFLQVFGRKFSFVVLKNKKQQFDTKTVWRALLCWGSLILRVRVRRSFYTFEILSQARMTFLFVNTPLISSS